MAPQPESYGAPVPRKSRNAIGLRQAAAPAVLRASAAVEQDRPKVEEGTRTLLFGDLTSEAIEGGGRSLLRLISGRILNLKLGPLPRLDSRPACADATVQPGLCVSARPDLHNRALLCAPASPAVIRAWRKARSGT